MNPEINHIAMKLHLLLVSLLLPMLVASCDKGSTAENLEHAEFAIERQDYSTAKGICDNLREEQNDAESMDAVTLCNLSILYMKLSESIDREDNIGMARQCYLDAYAADSAGARDFYDHVPVEDMPHLSLLSSIVKSTSGISSGIHEEYIDEGDSISGLN